MGIPTGDFIGFTYNGVHSTQLGILRVNNGSRLTESLLPTMQDKIVQIPGNDGTYYFNSYYTQKNFSVSFAFDSVTEVQLRKMKRVFGDKGIHELIFDEMPFKIYQAKVTGMATIKYICFDQGPDHRLYKGEGDIQFTAFKPYAVTKKKYLNQYNEKNKEEWAQASGLLKEQGGYDKISTSEDGILLYNPGDLEADWKLKLVFQKGEGGSFIPETTIRLGESGLSLSQITQDSTEVQDDFIIIDTATNLIEGFKEDLNGFAHKTGKIYNQYIEAGDFFKIPCNKMGAPMKMTFDNVASLRPSLKDESLQYNYYYL